MRELIGKVISTKMTKTVVVEIERLRPHPLYKKYIRSTRRIKAHNENLSIKEGDLVRIIPTRPISKDKHFQVVSKVLK